MRTLIKKGRALLAYTRAACRQGRDLARVAAMMEATTWYLRIARESEQLVELVERLTPAEREELDQMVGAAMARLGRTFAVLLQEPRCSYGPHVATTRVRWSDREMLVCQPHIVDAKLAAAHDGPHDATNHPLIEAL